MTMSALGKSEITVASIGLTAQPQVSSLKSVLRPAGHSSSVSSTPTSVVPSPSVSVGVQMSSPKWVSELLTVPSPLVSRHPSRQSSMSWHLPPPVQSPLTWQIVPLLSEV